MIFLIARCDEHYVCAPEEMPEECQKVAEMEGVERAACDYVAGMTDYYALESFSRFFIPSAWHVK